LRRSRACGADQELVLERRRAFPLALAEATDNPLMVWLYRQINAVRGHAQWGEMKRKILTSRQYRPVQRAARELYEAIRRRDVARRCAASTSTWTRPSATALPTPDRAG
jgi:DNA-binding FadR family transcriptional regulator